MTVPLEQFLPALRALLRLCRRLRIPHVIIGGVAVSLLSRPRVTRDIDSVLFMDLDRLDTLHRQFLRAGFVSRRPDALAFARRHRVLLLRHKASAVDVDISLGALPFEEEMIARAHTVSLEQTEIPIPTPEDLIIMKAIAARPVDLVDITHLIDAHPKLDWRRIRRWVRDFANILERPELIDQLKSLRKKRQ